MNDMDKAMKLIYPDQKLTSDFIPEEIQDQLLHVQYLSEDIMDTTEESNTREFADRIIATLRDIRMTLEDEYQRNF